MTAPPRRSPADQKSQPLVADCPACSTPLRFTLEIDSAGPASSRTGAHTGLSEASVGAVMRPATFVSENTPLSEISELFMTTGGRLVIVVSPEQKPLGVVTPNHVLRALKRYDRKLGELRALEAATAGGAMLPDTTPLSVAVKLLIDQDRDFCVILGSDGRAVGVVVATDVLEKLLPEPP